MNTYPSLLLSRHLTPSFPIHETTNTINKHTTTRPIARHRLFETGCRFRYFGGERPRNTGEGLDFSMIAPVGMGEGISLLEFAVEVVEMSCPVVGIGVVRLRCEEERW